MARREHANASSGRKDTAPRGDVRFQRPAERSTDDGFAAVVASRRARANLSDRPVATIVVVCGDELHTFTCDVTARVETGEAAAFALAVRGHRRDGLGIELIPLRFRVAAKLRFEERWDRTEQLLQQLQSTLRPA